jgi:AraC family transcriptional regulator of adaptative response/methylated-DNA-[protein]-cysteine methyltransferase
MNTVTTRAPQAAAVDPRWQALVARDASADGRFFYSVRTTGVYCRPSCAARLPRRENVAFHATAAAAERAGFRACKRCHPDRIVRVDEDIRFAIAESALGFVLVARSTRGLCAVLLGDSAAALGRDLRRRFPHARLLNGAADEESLSEVVRALEDPRHACSLPLDLRGTPFQRRVWRALQGIPAGRTVSYAELARRIGAARAVRAVAQACGANALAVLVPCHRVVRSDGALSGYRWGSERKRALLAREGRA